MKSEPEPAQPPAQPWWKQGVVWGLIAGPAIAVVAGVVTTVIAVQGADSLVTGDSYRRGAEINQQRASERAQMPAHQARNHAATPTAQP
ncbi:FixH family protein [Ramlibacter tataouinensis]|uniref:FixH family protein n=1 Tax=Ramlibacter tataouinensis TaxID=94132 RepID=UPI0022F3C2C1|nr:FixH family protein [Ramlibacter tataouinensis]WBY02484.1 FixH family protein [Ramlibacter tataouinensis]